MSRYVIEGTTTARTNTWLRAVALARKRRATIITEHQRDARPAHVDAGTYRRLARSGRRGEPRHPDAPGRDKPVIAIVRVL
jgi:hypothetical protein